MGVGIGLGYYGGYYDDYYPYYDDTTMSSPVMSTPAMTATVAYCIQRFRTYDLATRTYVGKGGRRIRAREA